MMLNMLNVQITERMIAGTRAGLSEGRVIERNCCQRVAPSTRAASYRSAEIDCNAPREITIMNGTESQALVEMQANRDVEVFSNQDTGGPPNIWMIWLKTPNCWCNIPFHLRA